ncbi:GNAT family N-acetyltransferase [Psychroserpens sp. S379A]|uniref:GNAT family N-acetyltransferase n=1 Tax=Psychroserpens sp. S379A TaxID=3415137 RepID=UPI003C7B5FDD
MNIEVRALKPSDIESIVDYFHNSSIDFLKGMGADKSKLPSRTNWIKNLQSEYKKTFETKGYYYVIWLLDGEAIGHSNINHIAFGESATMHLHLWQNSTRKSGMGLQFLKMTIPYYFENFQLEKLICEPFSENIAPNKTLRKLGFEFIKTYETIPGPINFSQKVNRYEMSKTLFHKMKNESK